MDEISELRINMAEFKKDVTYIKEALKKGEVEFAKNNEAHETIIASINDFVQTADERYLDKREHTETLKKIDDFIEACVAERKTYDRRYSPIWVASTIKWAGYTLGGAILIGLLYFIASVYLHINIR